jgi:DNA polymerase III subunit alpha
VEIVVFEKALSAAEGVVAPDEIVMVRGRVDHKEAGKVCVIVQDVERFEPSDREIAKARETVAKLDQPPEPLCRRVDARRLPAAVIDELRELIERYPGEAEFVLELDTRTGLRRLRFGTGYRVAAGHASFKAELDRLLGPARAAVPVAEAAVA